jgi:hypothetical protein
MKAVSQHIVVLAITAVVSTVTLIVNPAFAGTISSRRASIHDTMRVTEIRLLWDRPVHESVRDDISELASERIRKPLTNDGLSDLLHAILSSLTDRGYRRAAIVPHDFVETGDAFEFSMSINPGSIHTIAAWRFSGLNRTDTTWLAKVLDLPCGVTWSNSLRSQIERRIHRISHLYLSGEPGVIGDSDDTCITIELPFAERATALADGALSLGSGSASQDLNGKLSLEMLGLFGRDRSLGLNYEHPRPEESLLRFRFSERGIFGSPWSWRLALEQLDRLDHRRSIELGASYGGVAMDGWRIEGVGRLAQITPGRTGIRATRTQEATFGLSNRPDQRLPLIYVSPGLYVSAHATWSHARSGLGAGTLDEPQSIARLRTDLRAAQVIALNRRWRLRFDGVGRWWPRHEQLVAGDEWYLGGEGWLQGYSDRDVVAASGWVLVSELMCDLAREVAAAAFAETGLLTGFAAPDGRTVRPSSYGIAIMLHSRQRYGRLQVAWRDGAAWGDGLIRLNVSHGW